jgi:hypothetical protein
MLDGSIKYQTPVLIVGMLIKIYVGPTSHYLKIHAKVKEFT